MFETMIRGMYESGIRPRPYRTNGKLDALIEGQKETDDKLKEINGILKGINETLQEILKKVETRYPNGVARA